MPGSEYGTIPYELEEINAFLQDYFDTHLPDMLTEATTNPLYFATDDILWSNDSEKNKNWSSYQIIKKIEIIKPINPDSEFRVHWEMKVTAGTGYAKIYKNGEAFGTEKSTTSGSYVNKNDDLSPWKKGDTVELWIYNSVSQNTWVRNFRLLGNDNLGENTNY